MSQMINYGSELIRINQAKKKVEYSTNGGSSWYSRSNFPSGAMLYDMIVYGNEIIATSDKYVYYSTNKGGSWYSRSMDKNVINTSLSVNGNQLLAMGPKGLYYSTNKGGSWYRK